MTTGEVFDIIIELTPRGGGEEEPKRYGTARQYGGFEARTLIEN